MFAKKIITIALLASGFAAKTQSTSSLNLCLRRGMLSCSQVHSYLQKILT
jgi:hypothetical protein